MKGSFFILFLTFVAVSAAAQNDTIMQEADIIRIQYADQNNNRYILSPEKIEYRPIQPHESSSGTYSGGEPKTVEWTIEEWETCKELAKEILKNEQIHLTQRRMLTSLLYVSFSEKEENVRVILGRSELHQSFLEKLKELLD